MIIKINNLYTVTILRALAALSVFYYHHQLGRVLADYTHIQIFRYTDAVGATYAVPLFFLISGFCIHLSCLKYLKGDKKFDLKTYLHKRVKRIYPAYIFALFVSITINALINPNQTLTVADFFIHLVNFQGFSNTYFNTINIVFWTISIEIGFYLLYPLFFYLRKASTLNMAILFVFLVSFTSISLILIHGKTNLIQRYLVTNIWFSWCVGAFIAEKVASNLQFYQNKKLIIGYLVILVAYISSFLIHFPQVILDQINILIWVLPFLWFISKEAYIIQKKHFLSLRLLLAMGTCSYSIYLLHEPLIGLKNFLVSKYLPAMYQQIGLALGIFPIFGICWISYIFIEKVYLNKIN